jgi:hypothetical protein
VGQYSIGADKLPHSSQKHLCIGNKEGAQFSLAQAQAQALFKESSTLIFCMENLHFDPERHNISERCFIFHYLHYVNF